MSEKIVIDLPEGESFDFAGLKGVVTGKLEFDATKESVVSHLMASGRSDLVPLVDDTVNPVTGEPLPVPEVVEEPPVQKKR